MKKKTIFIPFDNELNQDLSCPPRVCRPAGGSVRAARLAAVDWVVVRGEDRGRTSLGIPAQPSPAHIWRLDGYTGTPLTSSSPAHLLSSVLQLNTVELVTLTGLGEAAMVLSSADMDQ